MHKKEQATERNKFKEEIKTEIKDSIKQEFREEFEKNTERDSRIMETLNTLTTNINTLTEGLLSVQRREFEANCRNLLNPEHNITLDEFQQITDDHDIYNKLGGNHSGDQLFSLVEEKAKHHFG